MRSLSNWLARQTVNLVSSELVGSSPTLRTKNEINKMGKNEIKKQLYKSKVDAKFSHYLSGSLYYTVELSDGVYQFPISVIEKSEDDKIELSSDLGTTSFDSEIKGSSLNRWISMAYDDGEFIKIK